MIAGDAEVGGIHGFADLVAPPGQEDDPAAGSARRVDGGLDRRRVVSAIVGKCPELGGGDIEHRPGDVGNRPLAHGVSCPGKIGKAGSGGAAPAVFRPDGRDPAAAGGVEGPGSAWNCGNRGRGCIVRHAARPKDGCRRDGEKADNILQASLRVFDVQVNISRSGNR